MLQESSRAGEINAIEGLKQTAATLNSLVSYLSEEKTKGDAAINEILLSNHPAFSALRKLVGIPYPIIFKNVDEISALLGARGFTLDRSSPNNPQNEYQWDSERLKYGIGMDKIIFDDHGRLKIFTPDQWSKSWIRKYDYDPKPQDDDDIPF